MQGAENAQVHVFPFFAIICKTIGCYNDIRKEEV